jgi:hypothetical protein
MADYFKGFSICKIKFFSQRNLSTHPLDFVDLEAFELITEKSSKISGLC